ncbi:MAG TPA: polymer-forming cytoskeletal protein [Bacteroidales bacterium]|nr:polymer-forming cytoskeletal protein [Bacteroidales bacterium]
MIKGKENEVPSINLLGAGTVVKGEIKLNGDFRIDGTFIGTIHCKGKVVVGTTGVIEGEINCQNADFSGEVKATVKVSELLTLKETAKFTGDITTNKLSIEPGAKFSGNCIMEGSLTKPAMPPLRPDEPRSKETVA